MFIRTTISTAAIAFAALLTAQTVYPLRLTPEMTEGGDVTDAKVSPDGRYAVYRADQDEDEVFELYSVPVNGGQITKLNEDLSQPSFVREQFEITSDGQRVVFLVDSDTPGTVELASSTIATGDITYISGNIADGGGVMGFRLTPDGSTVVFEADDDANGTYDLFAVSTAGGPVVQLNTGAANGTAIITYLVSPDGNHVAFRVSGNDLYSVPLGVANPLPNLIDGNGFGAQFTPDSASIVYLRGGALYRVPATGGSAVKLAGNHLPDDAVLRSFRLTPDGERVVYLAEPTFLSGNESLFSVGIDGSIPTRLISPSIPNNDIASSFVISPDSRWVAYKGRTDSNDEFHLYLAPISGAPSRPLPGFSPTARSGAVSFDETGERLIYESIDPGTSSILYSAAVEHPDTPPLVLSDSLLSGTHVDRGRAIYHDFDPTLFNYGFFSIPTGGGTTTVLGPRELGIHRPTTPGFAAAAVVRFSPIGSEIFYTRGAVASEKFGLYVTRPQGVWDSAGSSWFTPASWASGTIPDATVQALIHTPATVTVESYLGTATADGLVLGGGAGPSVLEFVAGGTLALADAVQFYPGAILRGDGTLRATGFPLDLPLGAGMVVRENEQLAVDTGAVTNHGAIEVSGRGIFPARIEFSGAVTNAAGTGIMTGTDAAFRFHAGMMNDGSVVFGAGLNEVRGAIDNRAAGRLIVSGGASTIFYDDINNAGGINVSASGGIQSSAIFFGALSGNGVSGGGSVFIEGDTRPGFSPGVMAFGGDLSYGPFASILFEIGGTSAGSDYDQIVVSGDLMLNGNLAVQLTNDFFPEPGAVFTLLQAGSMMGNFLSVNLPSLPRGRFWHLSDLETAGTLSVGLTPDSYPAFAAAFGLTTAPEKDQDGDGLANLFEYLTGRDPTIADAAGATPRLSGSLDALALTFPLAQPGARDTTLELETSTTLGDAPADWEVIARNSGDTGWDTALPVKIVSLGNGIEEVRFSLPVPPEGYRRFFRLRAQLLP